LAHERGSEEDGKRKRMVGNWEMESPRRAETDEESLVLSGHGLQHGRLKVFNTKVKHSLTTSFTCLKAVLTLTAPLSRLVTSLIDPNMM
jgi:hypothetical protein